MSLNTTDEQYYFEFPCTISTQGNLLVIMMSVPFRMLKRFMAFNNTGHVLDRSQREINPSRVKKIVQYLLDAHHQKQPFILPPIIANSNKVIDVELFGKSSVGMARVPMDAEFDLFDGQHRTAGVIEFARHIEDSSAIGVMLTQQLSLQQRQQFFSDINNNVSKPNATINLAYNSRDQLTSQLLEMFRTHAVFSRITDFEHNTVPAKSDCLVSFKPLCDATAKFIGAGDARLTNEQLITIWEAWLNLTAVNDVAGIPLSSYKKDYIQFYSVMLNAFGMAVQELRAGRSPEEVATLINTLAISTDTRQKEQFFTISSWDGYCVSVAGDRVKIQADVSAQRAAGGRLAEVLRSASL